jgi:RND family efflux transporter MFP subunit
MKPGRQILITLLVVVAAAAGWYFLGPRSEKPGAATAGAEQSNRGPGRGNINVVTEPVAFETVTDELQSVGTAVAVRAVTLFPQVTGVVTEVAVDAGQSVEKETVLYRFESETQAVAVERARIAAEDAKAALGRAEQLAESRNIAAVALSEARSRVASAEIDMRTAELELDRRTVRAPFTGIVGIPGPKVGDMVTTSTALITLDDPSAFTVAFEIPERFAPMLKVGDAVTATSAGLPGVAIGGAVSAVDSRVDADTRTFRVEARLDRGIDGLKPGMSVVVRLAFPQAPRATVPSMAIQWDRSGAFVWKVESDKAVRTPVQILNRRSGIVYVLGSLKENDPVVVEGVQRLRDGVAVVPTPQPTTDRRAGSAEGNAPAGAGG